jgi:FSR family fosmidomycin resistance protein-like MFS transporter
MSSNVEGTTTNSSARRDPDRFQTGQVATLAAGHAVHDTFTAFLPPLLPALIEKFLLSKTQAGLLSVFMQAPSLLQPFIGHLSDRFGLRLVVVMAPAISGAAMSLLGIAPGYWALALLLTIAGISSAGLHAVAPVIAGRRSGPSLGRAMGLWMVGGEMGRTLGPIVIVTAVAALTLEGTAVLMVAGFAASAVLFVKLGSAPAAAAGEHSRASYEWREALRRMRPVMVPLVAVAAARSIAVGAFAVFLPTYLTEEGRGLWFAGASLSVLELAGVAGALTGGWLSDHLGRRRVLAAGMALTPMFVFLFLFTSGWIRFPLLLALGFSLFSFGPVIMALVQEQFPGNRALANGVYMSIAFLIRSAGIVMVGVIGDLWGLMTAFVVGGVLVVAGVPFVFALPARPGRSRPSS